MSLFFLGRKLSGRFVIPSGVLTTRIAIIERIAEMVPQVGIITTKSVGVEPEPGNREPILAEDSPLNFINAVGLRSPGMMRMREELHGMRDRHEDDGLFNEKFLMVSLYGKTEEEFATLIRYLEPVADGFELNLSCPHSKPGYGASIGSHPETTFQFTRASVYTANGISRERHQWVNSEGNVPVFVKLTPNVADIGIIAEAAMKGGATGITAINTVGPIEHRDPISGEPVLTHVTGGKSGKWIREMGVAAVNNIRERIGPSVPIIGMGGITTANDVRSYRCADLFGIGSGFAGLDIREIADYFRQLEQDLEESTNRAHSLLVNRKLMDYHEFHIQDIQKVDEDLRVFEFDGDFRFLPGQFMFLWLPGKGEKPFSPALHRPLTIAIRKRGILTSEFFTLKEGDRIMIRGPYGRGFLPDPWDSISILAGGTGSGAALSLAHRARSLEKEVTVFQGCVSERQLLFEDEFMKCGGFHIGIDRDEPGEVLNVMRDHLETNGVAENSVFFNIGPEEMMRHGMRIENKFLPEDRIFASVERETQCGVGLCGTCELNGYRTCIRGTVFTLEQLRCGINGRYLI